MHGKPARIATGVPWSAHRSGTPAVTRREAGRESCRPARRATKSAANSMCGAVRPSVSPRELSTEQLGVALVKDPCAFQGDLRTRRDTGHVVPIPCPRKIQLSDRGGPIFHLK